ncbi:hypothetical protein [Thermus scotoductus]|uniref:hypothetical protein n=1 Tax=Thermus scotoductus TaxID=37636 RepID=UPI0015623B04|nr:hypothetical protein [Thermus scotoductus]
MRKLFLFLALLLSSACGPTPLQVSLSPQRALVGEEVTATPLYTFPIPRHS